MTPCLTHGGAGNEAHDCLDCRIAAKLQDVVIQLRGLETRGVSVDVDWLEGERFRVPRVELLVRLPMKTPVRRGP